MWGRWEVGEKRKQEEGAVIVVPLLMTVSRNCTIDLNVSFFYICHRTLDVFQLLMYRITGFI